MYARGLFIALICLSLSLPAIADTWLVRQDGTGDHMTIQGAIDAANPGDVINIGSGTYPESILIDKSLTLESDGAAGDVVLDGQDSFRIMVVEGALDLTLRNLTYTHGWSDNGSALLIWQGADVIVEACRFNNNYAWESNAVHVRHDGTNASFHDCEFRHNSCDWHSAALSIGIGGYLLAEGCVFADNTSGGYGAVNSNAAQIDIRDCLFLRNSGSVGALACVLSNGEIAGNTFHENSGSNGTVSIGSGMTFTHNIITSELLGPGLSCAPSAQHACNLFYDNIGGAMVGGTLADDELEVDPRYCDFDADDFSLCESSMALAVNNGCGDMGAFSMGCQVCGPVAIEAEAWGSVKAMYR